MDNGMRKAIADLKENEKYLIENIVMVAKFNRSYYEELIKRGFSKQEAIELLKAHGISFNSASQK